jgi:predicted transcriptional regulator of viral defense system
MRGWRAKVRVLADRQWGRVSWAQFAALGVDDQTIARWCADGYLDRVLPRVYAVGHRAPSVEADLTAAVLYAGPGAMLSHATALWWRGLFDNRPWPIEVSTPRRCRSLRGVAVHGRRDCRRVWHKSLPVTTIEQALLDFAAQAPLDRVRYALANADYLKVLDLDALRAVAGAGRAGSAKLRTALQRHEPKLARTRSPLERIFLPFCESHGIPLPDDVNVRIEGILVDAVWWRQRLIVELDGRDNHSSWAQIQRDRSNEITLRGAGFDVVRYGMAQFDDDPEPVAADLLRKVRSTAA